MITSTRTNFNSPKYNLFKTTKKTSINGRQSRKSKIIYSNEKLNVNNINKLK